MSVQKSTTLEAAFAELERLAREREDRMTASDPDVFRSLATQSVINSDSTMRTASRSAADCLCNRNQNALYLRHEGSRSTFDVCPACDPQLRCEDCQGTGQLRRFNLLTLKDEVIPGACACRASRKRADLLNQIQLPRRYQTASFNNLQTAHLGKNQNLIQKLNDCRERVLAFCESVTPYIGDRSSAPDKIFLTLLGPVGTGKTLLGCAALRWLVEETGCTARFTDFLYLLSQLRETYTQNGSEEKVLKPLRDADVLLIDELGKGRAEKAWQMEKLDDLLNSRYNSGRITILTTNYLPPGATYDPVRAGFRSAPANESFWEQSLPERIGARMFDRIAESSVFVDFIGLPSFRQASAEAFLQRQRSESVREF